MRKALRRMRLIFAISFALPLAAQQQANGPGSERSPATQPAIARANAVGLSKGRVAPADDPTYVIGPMDVLDVTVWKEADFSRAEPVRIDGKISLPLLGDLQAAGLTPMQLSTSIEQRLVGYVIHPKVTVIVTAMNSGRIYILGEVNRPGPISLSRNMTVLQALATAGGLSQFANQKHIYILREENGKQVRYPFDYKKAIRGSRGVQNIVLKPEDTIIVP